MEEAMMDEVKPVHLAMLAVAADVGAIGKDHRMTQGPAKYQYRGIESILPPFQKACIEHGVTLTPTVTDVQMGTVTTGKGKELSHAVLTVAWRWTGPAGDWLDTATVGEAIDSGDKAVNKAMTAAQKLAITHALHIPLSEAEDPDHQTHERVAAPNPVAEAKRRLLAAAGGDKDVAAALWEKHGLDGIDAAVAEAQAPVVVDQDALAEMSPPPNQSQSVECYRCGQPILPGEPREVDPDGEVVHAAC